MAVVPHRLLGDVAHLEAAQQAGEAPAIREQAGVPADAVDPVSSISRIRLSFSD